MAVVQSEGRGVAPSFGSSDGSIKVDFQQFSQEVISKYEEINTAWKKGDAWVGRQLNEAAENGYFPFNYAELGLHEVPRSFSLDWVVFGQLEQALKDSKSRLPEITQEQFVKGLYFIAHILPDQAINLYEKAQQCPWMSNSMGTYPDLKTNLDDIIAHKDGKAADEFEQMSGENFGSLQISQPNPFYSVHGASVHSSLSVSSTQWPCMPEKVISYLDLVMPTFRYRFDPETKMSDGTKAEKQNLFTDKLATRAGLDTEIVNVRTQAKSPQIVKSLQSLHLICSVMIRDLPETEGFKNPETKDNGQKRELKDKEYYEGQNKIKREVISYFSELKRCLETRAIAIGAQLDTRPIPQYKQ